MLASLDSPLLPPSQKNFPSRENNFGNAAKGQAFIIACFAADYRLRGQRSIYGSADGSASADPTA